MYIPDPIEIMENRAERWADDNIKGSNFKCGCGNWCDINEAVALSSNPYAIPVCSNCAEEYIKRMEKI
jgi:hypothetical protein